MLWKVWGLRFFKANCFCGNQSCPTPPKRSAVRTDPSCPWFVQGFGHAKWALQCARQGCLSNELRIFKYVKVNVLHMESAIYLATRTNVWHSSNAEPWHTTFKSKMYAQGSAWKDMVQQNELPRHSFAQTMNYSSEVVGCIFVLHMYCQMQTNKWFRTFFGITTQVLAQTRVAHFPWPFTIVFIRIGIRDSFSDYLCAVIVLNL